LYAIEWHTKELKGLTKDIPLLPIVLPAEGFDLAELVKASSVTPIIVKIEKLPVKDSTP